MINCLLDQWPSTSSCISGNSSIVFILLFMVCHLKYQLGRLKIKLLFPQTSFCFHLVNSNISFSSYFEFNWSQHGSALGLRFTVFIHVHQGQWADENMSASGKGDTKPPKTVYLRICFQTSHTQKHFPPTPQHSRWHWDPQHCYHQTTGMCAAGWDCSPLSFPTPAQFLRAPANQPATQRLKSPQKPNTSSSLDTPEANSQRMITLFCVRYNSRSKKWNKVCINDPGQYLWLKKAQYICQRPPTKKKQKWVPWWRRGKEHPWRWILHLQTE